MRCEILEVGGLRPALSGSVLLLILSFGCCFSIDLIMEKRALGKKDKGANMDAKGNKTSRKACIWSGLIASLKTAANMAVAEAATV